MACLETRLFDETLLEKLAEYLSPEGAVELRAHWRALSADPPSVSGYGIEPIDFIPPSLDKCQESLSIEGSTKEHTSSETARQWRTAYPGTGDGASG